MVKATNSDLPPCPRTTRLIIFLPNITRRHLKQCSINFRIFLKIHCPADGVSHFHGDFDIQQQVIPTRKSRFCGVAFHAIGLAGFAEDFHIRKFLIILPLLFILTFKRFGDKFHFRSEASRPHNIGDFFRAVFQADLVHGFTVGKPELLKRPFINSLLGHPLSVMRDKNQLGRVKAHVFGGCQQLFEDGFGKGRIACENP